jgi:hypothetical protein
MDFILECIGYDATACLALSPTKVPEEKTTNRKKIIIRIESERSFFSLSYLSPLKKFSNRRIGNPSPLSRKYVTLVFFTVSTPIP